MNKEYNAVLPGCEVNTMAQYAHPEVLVDTSWVKGSLGDQNVRIVEVDYDPTSNYNLGPIPGSSLIDWRKDINDPVTRDIVSKKDLESLFGRLGITNKHRIVLYGDFNNWFAAFAFCVFKYYGVDNVVLLNGGRKKWIAQDLPVTKDLPPFPVASFKAKEPDETLRVYLPYVREAYRQTVVAHVVRPEVPPWIPERPKLRWVLDGVGESRADADREVAFSRARASIPRHSRKAREGATPVSTRPFVRCRMGCNSFEPVRLFGRAFSRQRVASPVPASAIRNDLNSPAEIQRDRRYISSQGSKRPPHFPCRRGESCRRQSSTIRCRRYPLVQNEKGKSGLGFSREFGHKEKPVSFKELSTPPMG